ncbi:MAG: hotdog domain-containing protein [Myxococcales bacterium]|jgi:acyl-coenzyme A thioesterase PaaI-like protein
MEVKTHLRADPQFCGRLLDLSDGSARVALDTTGSMVVDDKGLIHGGFVFGTADYAAMLAVNDPNVVLGAASARFLKPVREGDRLIATARAVATRGSKREVLVEATVDSVKVFEGTFTCVVLERHVLERAGSK